MKKDKKLTNKTPIEIYVNKNQNRDSFKNKGGYLSWAVDIRGYELLGSTEEKTTKDKNNENALRLESTEVALVHCNCNNVTKLHQEDLKAMDFHPLWKTWAVSMSKSFWHYKTDAPKRCIKKQ